MSPLALITWPVWVIGFHGGRRTVWVATGVAWLLSMWYGWHELTLWGVVGLALLWLAVGVMGMRLGQVRQVAKQDMDTLYSEAAQQLELLRQEDVQLQNQLDMWGHRIAELEDLYEVTKRMSGSMTFDEIFHILSGMLREVFEFDTAYVALAPSNDHGWSHPQVHHEDASGDEELAEWEEEAIRLAAESREVITVPPAEETAPSIDVPDRVQSAIFIPLEGKGEVLGVLVVMGLYPGDFEKILVIAGQFALQLNRVRLYEQVQELAVTDGLTRVYVRRYVMGRMEEELARAAKRKTSLAVVMVDVDHFKACNDTYGHLVGDVVLREVAQILMDNVRDIDLVGRYGGEEFVLLLLDADRDEAVRVAERIRQATADQEIRAYDEVLKTTISLGVALAPIDGEDADTLIDASDRALYAAKAAGRNRVWLSSPEPS